MQPKDSKLQLIHNALRGLRDDFSLPWQSYQCLEWDGGADRLWNKRKVVLFYRAAYEEAIGPIPHRAMVFRKCQNPACFRPSHLRMVRNAELLMRELLTQSTDDDACIEWPAAKNSTGYGIMARTSTNTGSGLVHRVAYEATFGPIANGLVLRHKCDNPPCIRPSHMVPGTQWDNVNDAVLRGRIQFVTSAKLCASDVAEIRRLLALGETQASIATKFNVCQSNIWHIANGRSWKRLP